MTRSITINEIAIILTAMICMSLASCTNSPHRNKPMKVICVPVFGQSIALGEEAIRITDFDTLAVKYNHRIVTERMDEAFGFFSDTELKQSVKRLINYDKRSFELSVYGMAEEYLERTANDSIIICVFPGGQGETSITGMMPDSKAYNKFIDEIKAARRRAVNLGWTFELPAYCWMQGENDIAWQTSRNYRKDMEAWHEHFCNDVKAITGQENTPICICYQANCLSRAERRFTDSTFHRPETYVPNAQYQLIKQRTDFMASGPTYPYDAVGERIHIDAIGQKCIGHLAGLTLWRISQGENSDGLLPDRYFITDSTHIALTFIIPHPPLVLDDTQVSNPGNYGFTVISEDGHDIIKEVKLTNDTIYIECTKAVTGARLRYAVNGIAGKSGRRNGARGCLRDSQGNVFKCNIQGKTYRMDNWCFQFDIPISH